MNEKIKKLDEMLLSMAGKYCHPDAPKEFIIISEEPIKPETCESDLLKQLNLADNENKVTVKLQIEGREVEIIKRPELDGRLEVVIKREPKNTTLTYGEVYSILGICEKLLGIKIAWKKPFPRGSC